LGRCTCCCAGWRIRSADYPLINTLAASLAQESDICLQAITTIFQTDMSSTHSLPLVRLLNRMIKERHFNVHPNVLSCLWHVKVRAAPSKESSAPHKRRWDKDRDWKKKAERGKGVNKERTAYEQGGEWAEKKREWRTKKMRKDMKEKKAIEKEMDEAGAEIDEEEANRNQTETLQHLFVLYFSILKQTRRTPLLPAALEGLARFAHLVNVDFFRDLLGVLRTIVKGDRLDELVDAEDSEDESLDTQGWGAGRGAEDKTRLRLLAIVTAFELLSGQGTSALPAIALSSSDADRPLSFSQVRRSTSTCPTSSPTSTASCRICLSTRGLRRCRCRRRRSLRLMPRARASSTRSRSCHRRPTFSSGRSRSSSSRPMPHTRPHRRGGRPRSPSGF
jgi:hypothetical protein